MLKKQQTMKDLPKEEQPYEKFETYGAESLSNAELLAVILRTGTKGMTALSLAKNILGENNMTRVDCLKAKAMLKLKMRKKEMEER